MVSQRTDILKSELPLEEEQVTLQEERVNGLVLVDIINGFCTVGAGSLVCNSRTLSIPLVPQTTQSHQLVSVYSVVVFP